MRLKELCFIWYYAGNEIVVKLHQGYFVLFYCRIHGIYLRQECFICGVQGNAIGDSFMQYY